MGPLTFNRGPTQLDLLPIAPPCQRRSLPLTVAKPVKHLSNSSSLRSEMGMIPCTVLGSSAWCSAALAKFLTKTPSLWRYSSRESYSLPYFLAKETNAASSDVPTNRLFFWIPSSSLSASTGGETKPATNTRKEKTPTLTRALPAMISSSFSC